MSCIPIVLFSNVVVKWTYNIAFIIFRMVMIRVTILLLCKINHQACGFFFFFYFATLIQHSRHLECLVLGITIIISRNYIIVLYQLVYNPHGFKNWTESWTIFFKILGSTLFLTGFFGLLTSFHWFWVFFQIGLASNSRFNRSIRSSF